MQIPPVNLKSSTSHILLLVTIMLAGCRTTGPLETNRPATLTQSELSRIGRQAWTDFQSKYPAVQDKKTIARVKTTLMRLVRSNDWRNKTWDVHVYANGPATAFILPPRYFAIQADLCSRLHSDSALAGVIAHLFGHMTAVHGSERLGKLLPANPEAENLNLVKLVELAYAGHATEPRETWRPFRPHHEHVADTLSVIYMARAGYKPKALLDVWDELSKTYDSLPLLLRVHPMSPERRGKLENALGRAQVWY